MTNKLPKVVGFASSAISYLAIASTAFAQATSSASKGGTESSLPSAGTTELTYFLFMAGVVLFVLGTLKLVASFREN